MPHTMFHRRPACIRPDARASGCKHGDLSPAREHRDETMRQWTALLVLPLAACQPEVTLEVTVLHGEHAGEAGPQAQTARVQGRRRSIEVRGEIPVRGSAQTQSPPCSALARRSSFT